LLAHDFLEDFISFDRRIFITIRDLFLKPGQVPLDYIKGKRLKYIQPTRLFLFSLLLLFGFIYLLPSEYSDTMSKLGFTVIIPEEDIDHLIFVNTHFGIVTSEVSAKKDRKAVEDKVALNNKIVYNRERANTLFIFLFKNTLFLVPVILSLLYKVVLFRRKTFFVEHLVFSFYITTILVLLNAVSHILISNMLISSIIPFAFFMFYLMFAVRKFYTLSYLRSFGLSLVVNCTLVLMTVTSFNLILNTLLSKLL